MRASRLFSVPAFRFSLADPKSAVGKWSRIATFGPKSKDGAEMMFDATTLGQMVDNAAARGDRIAIDNDHASAYPETRDAPALGFFGALAVVAGGRVVKSWNGSPDPAGLDDGLYGRLDEITPRGADPLVGLANYRTLSPMFVEEGTDEQNRPIGYALLNVAATNVPFQSGAEIMFFGVPANDQINSEADAADISTVMASSPADLSTVTVGQAITVNGKSYVVTKVWNGELIDLRGGRGAKYGLTRNRSTGEWYLTPFSSPFNTQHVDSISAATSANGATTMGPFDFHPRIPTYRGTWNGAPNDAGFKQGDTVFYQHTGYNSITVSKTPDGANTTVAWPHDVTKMATSAAPANGATTMAQWAVGDRVKDTNPNGYGPRGQEGRITYVHGDGMFVKVKWENGIEADAPADSPYLKKMSTNSPGAARAFQGASMNPEMMQKIGLADGCSPQDKMAKYSAYAMGDASPEELKAMADDIEAMSAWYRVMTDRDDPSGGGWFVQADSEEDAKAKAKAAGRGNPLRAEPLRMAAAKFRKLALPFEGKETPEEEKAEAGKLAALARTLGVPATVAAIEAAVVPMSQFSALQVRLSAIEAERAAEKKAAADRKVSELVDRAVAGGYPADQKDALTRFARADFGGAEALVARHVSQNATLFTSVSRGRGSSSPSASGSDVVERGAIVSFGQNLADAIKAHRKSNPKMSYEDAAAEVAATRPELAASYLSYGRQ